MLWLGVGQLRFWHHSLCLAVIATAGPYVFLSYINYMIPIVGVLYWRASFWAKPLNGKPSGHVINNFGDSANAKRLLIK